MKNAAHKVLRAQTRGRTQKRGTNTSWFLKNIENNCQVKKTAYSKCILHIFDNIRCI